MLLMLLKNVAIEKLAPRLAVVGGVAGAWPAVARERTAEPVVRLWEAL